MVDRTVRSPACVSAEGSSMPRRADYNDEWDEEFGGDEDGFDASNNGDVEPAIPCPYCHKQIHEDAPRCPHCGNYVSEEDAPPGRKPWWIIVGTLACLYAVYRWILG